MEGFGGPPEIEYTQRNASCVVFCQIFLNFECRRSFSGSVQQLYELDKFEAAVCLARAKYGADTGIVALH